MSYQFKLPGVSLHLKIPGNGVFLSGESCFPGPFVFSRFGTKF
jgi:hypothetical protein